PITLHRVDTVDAVNVELAEDGRAWWTIEGCDFGGGGVARWRIEGLDVVLEPPEGYTDLLWMGDEESGFQRRVQRVAFTRAGEQVRSLVTPLEGAEYEEPLAAGADCLDCCDRSHYACARTIAGDEERHELELSRLTPE